MATKIKQIHGVANARKIVMSDADVRQEVVVEDGQSEVKLLLGFCSYPAGLTPDQARMIARNLLASADRVEDTLADA